MAENVNSNELSNNRNSWMKNGMKQNKCGNLNMGLFPNDPNVKKSRWFKKKKKKPKNKDVNQTVKKSSNVKKGQKSEVCKISNEKKESKIRNLRKKRRRRRE